MGLGYSKLVSFELARITTRQHQTRDPTGSVRGPITAYSGKEPGFLPQGAPTSGALANAIAKDLDADLAALAAESNLVYTRYSDDIIFLLERHSIEAKERPWPSRYATPFIDTVSYCTTKRHGSSCQEPER